MESTRKYYQKAMDYYCEGHMEKALNFCEKCLSFTRDYSPALNLKGLIYYIKGDLEGAQLTWRTNLKLNGDEISKKYLEDSKKDKEVLETFALGVAYYKEIRIHEALDCFNKCERSHFNVINLHNYLALCYIKTGQYEKSNHYVNEVLKIQRDNELALDTKKSLIDMGVIKKEVNFKKLSFLLTIPLIVAIFIAIYSNWSNIKSVKVFDKIPKVTAIFKNTKNQQQKSENKELKSNEGSSKVEENKTAEEKNPTSKEEINKIATFNFDEVKKNYDKKDYEKLIQYLEEYNKESLTVNEKALLIKVEEEIRDSGVSFFYDKGITLSKGKDYKGAIDNFNKVYKYSDGNYLQEHLLYMLAYSYEKNLDVENANKYYETYVEKFDKGNYTEATLYSLALINEKIDKEKSKKYAKILVNNYKKSQYNNTRIRDIINK